jgi:hypothetical protein
MAKWQKPFDRLLKAMTQGEPHKAEKRAQKGRPDATKIEAEPPLDPPPS